MKRCCPTPLPAHERLEAAAYVPVSSRWRVAAELISFLCPGLCAPLAVPQHQARAQGLPSVGTEPAASLRPVSWFSSQSPFLTPELAGAG